MTFEEKSNITNLKRFCKHFWCFQKNKQSQIRLYAFAF